MTYIFKGIIDTTLRDGQQSPYMFDTRKYRFNLEEKKILINGLVKLGIDRLEFFSPAVSRVEKSDFSEIKNYLKTITGKKITKLAHCRCHPLDTSRAIEAGFDGLNLYMGASIYAQKFSHGKNKSGLKHLISTLVKNIRKDNPELYLRFSCEDAFRTPFADICSIYDEIADKIDAVGMPDTTGVATPESVGILISKFRKRYPHLDLECHFHNDRGMSLINSVAAVSAGANYIDASVWGLAERSGISSVSGLLLNLYSLNPHYTSRYNLALCYPLNVLLGSILKAQVPVSEPVSLTNRTHIAGVHQKAVLNNVKVYEAQNLEKFGVTKNQILLGPLSGWNTIYYYLKEVEGFDVTYDQAVAIAREYKDQVDRINVENRPESLLKKIVKNYPLVKYVIPSTYSGNRVENLAQ